jgi:hypothetical protein
MGEVRVIYVNGDTESGAIRVRAGSFTRET